MTYRRARPLSASLAFCVVLALPLGATQQAPAQRATGTLTEGVNAVVVDVVVRDRRGQPVRDLVQSDFEVLEDGVPQKIGAFTPVFEGGGLREPTRAAPATGVPGAAVAAPPVSGGPIVTALVFDRLSPEGRRLAIQASQSYLGTQAETPSYIGVFGVDRALKACDDPFRQLVLSREDGKVTSLVIGLANPDKQRTVPLCRPGDGK